MDIQPRIQSGAAAPHSKTQARNEFSTAATFWSAALLRRFGSLPFLELDSGGHNAMVAVMDRCAAIARCFVTTVLLASWNIATTHCSFAAAVAPPTPAVQQDSAGECPMHASKKTVPQPDKKNGCPDVPCCKTLPAAPAAKLIAAGKSPESGAKVDFTSRIQDEFKSPAISRRVDALDTGPPRPNKFAEVIFTRSVPAHAPPAVS